MAFHCAIAKNREAHILAIGGKPSYKGQNHGHKNNLSESSFVLAIRCRANPINIDYCAPREG